MAKKILCSECNKNLQSLANHYSELFESVEGKAKKPYKCDDCGVIIPKGSVCFAAVLLNNRNHPNYQFDKPSAWADSFIFYIKQ